MALGMHPIERQAWLYVAAEYEGFEVDWESGNVRQRSQQRGRLPQDAGRE